MVFQAKVMDQEQTLNAHTADVTKKHAEPLPLSATFHALKQLQKPTVCGNRLQVSCRRHILEKMFGNLERKIAQKDSYFKKTRGTHRMPTEKTLRKKFSKTAEQARF